MNFEYLNAPILTFLGTTIGTIIGILFLYYKNFLSTASVQIPCDRVYKTKDCKTASIHTLKTVEDFERCASAKLDPIIREYIWCGSHRQITLRENTKAYKRIRIRKRVLRDVSNPNLQTTILGQNISLPIAISPSAGHAYCQPDGEKATAKGAANIGTVMILSCYSTFSMEEVAASVPRETNLWMQTYILSNRKHTIQLVKRAEKAGYKAIVVTVDENSLTEYRCSSSTKFYEHYIAKPLKNIPNVEDVQELVVPDNITFEDIRWLKSITKLPIVVKGILSGEDAISAIDAGASAIYVSNHGGRQLDDTLATIDALPEVVDTLHSVYPGIEVYVDGGVRNGFDVYKAIARGANAVFIGRPNIWGLTMGGKYGVVKVLTILRNEFQEAMIHAGFSKPSQITRNSIVPLSPNLSCGSYYA